MKIRRLTFVIGLIGLSIMAFAIYRYLFMYYDPSTAVIFMGLGICAFGFSFIHNWHCDRDEQFKDLIKDVEANHKYLNDNIEPKLIKLHGERE
jgi:hypothetical protein